MGTADLLILHTRRNITSDELRHILDQDFDDYFIDDINSDVISDSDGEETDGGDESIYQVHMSMAIMTVLQLGV